MSSVNASPCCNSPFGSGLAFRKRRKASSICAAVHVVNATGGPAGVAGRARAEGRFGMRREPRADFSGCRPRPLRVREIVLGAMFTV